MDDDIRLDNDRTDDNGPYSVGFGQLASAVFWQCLEVWGDHTVGRWIYDLRTARIHSGLGNRTNHCTCLRVTACINAAKGDSDAGGSIHTGGAGV